MRLEASTAYPPGTYVATNDVYRRAIRDAVLTGVVLPRGMFYPDNVYVLWDNHWEPSLRESAIHIDYLRPALMYVEFVP